MCTDRGKCLEHVCFPSFRGQKRGARVGLVGAGKGPPGGPGETSHWPPHSSYQTGVPQVCPRAPHPIPRAASVLLPMLGESPMFHNSDAASLFFGAPIEGPSHQWVCRIEVRIPLSLPSHWPCETPFPATRCCLGDSSAQKIPWASFFLNSILFSHSQASKVFNGQILLPIPSSETTHSEKNSEQDNGLDSSGINHEM